MKLVRNNIIKALLLSPKHNNSREFTYAVVRQYRTQFVQLECNIFPWPGSRECIPQEPGRIEYYNQLFCLRGHHGGVSEIQTSLDVSDL